MHAASLKRLSPCRLVCAALGQTARTCSHGSRTRTSPASKLGDECTEGSALMPATSGPHRVALERGLRSGFFRLREFKFRECMLRPCPATCHVASVFAAQDPNVSSVFPCEIFMAFATGLYLEAGTPANLPSHAGDVFLSLSWSQGAMRSTSPGFRRLPLRGTCSGLQIGNLLLQECLPVSRILYVGNKMQRRSLLSRGCSCHPCHTCFLAQALDSSETLSA